MNSTDKIPETGLTIKSPSRIIRPALNGLLVLAFLHLIWVALSDAYTFRLGSHEIGVENFLDAWWIFFLILFLRILADWGRFLDWISSIARDRWKRLLTILLVMSVFHYLLVVLFEGLDFRLAGSDLGVENYRTAFWIVIVLAIFRAVISFDSIVARFRSPVPWILVGILLAAAVTITHNIDFGLPAKEHPDEPEIVAKPLRMATSGDLNPHYFVYPSFYFYSLVVVFRTYFEWPQLIEFILPFYRSLESDVTRIFLLARLTTALYGLLTILLLYPLGRRLYGRHRTGLLAAFFLAFAQLHIQNSRYITTDIPVTLFTTLTVYLSVRALDSGRFSPCVLFSALTAGLAASTKYNGASALVSPALVVLFFSFEQWKNNRQARNRIKILLSLTWRQFLLALVFLGGFLIGTPYAAIDFDSFWSSVLWDYDHYAGGHAGAMGDNNWRFYLSYLAHDGMGYGLFAFSAAGVILVAAGRRLKDLLYLVFAVIYFIEISVFTVRFTRNLCPVLPFFVLYAAVAFDRGVEWISRFETFRHRPSRRALLIVLVCLLLLTQSVVESVQVELRSRRPNSKYMAQAWVPENIPEDVVIAAELYSPSFDRQRYGRIYIRFLHRKNIDWYRAREVEYFIFNSHAYQRFYDHPEDYHSEIAEYDALFNHPDMILVKTFNEDFRHPGPVIKIYRLLEPGFDDSVTAKEPPPA